MKKNPHSKRLSYASSDTRGLQISAFVDSSSGQAAPPSFRYGQLSQGGFSLIEQLVGLVLLVILIGIGVQLFNSAVMATRKTGVFANAQALVDADVSDMKRMAEIYTCCNGTCQVPADTSTACPYYRFEEVSSSDPRDNTSYYYFPHTSTGAMDSAKRATFFSLCRGTATSGTLTGNLITAMVAKQIVAVPAITKTVAKASTDASDHLVSVTYASQSFTRQITFVPLVASWCP